MGLNVNYGLFIGPLVPDLLFEGSLKPLLLTPELANRVFILVHGPARALSSLKEFLNAAGQLFDGGVEIDGCGLVGRQIYGTPFADGMADTAGRLY